MKTVDQFWSIASVWYRPLVNSCRHALVLCGALHLLNANASDSSTKSIPDIDHLSIITRAQAQAYFLNDIEKSSEISSDPLQKEIMECYFKVNLDEIFIENKPLPAKVFRKRFHEAFEGNEKKNNLNLMKCFVNSKEVERATLEKRYGSANTNPPIALLDLDDLRVDYESLEGKKVKIKGVGRYMMDNLLFRKNKNDMNPIFIDITKTTRNQRKELLSKCGDSQTGCSLTVVGTVGSVGFQKGLVAESIAFE